MLMLKKMHIKITSRGGELGLCLISWGFPNERLITLLCKVEGDSEGEFSCSIVLLLAGGAFGFLGWSLAVLHCRLG